MKRGDKMDVYSAVTLGDDVKFADAIFQEATPTYIQVLAAGEIHIIPWSAIRKIVIHNKP